MLRKIIVAVIMAMPVGVLAIETVSSEAPNKQFLGQELVTGLIKTRIAEDQSLAFNVVMQGLADFPDEVVAIVIAAMQTGASTIDIASQCDTDIPTRIIPDLVSAAISQDADPELIVARCQIDIASQCDTDIPATVISNSITGAIPISNSITEAIPQDVDPEPRIAGCQCASAFDQTLNMLVEAMKNAESIQLKALLLDITINMIPRNGTTTVFDGYLSTLLLAGMQGDSSPQIDRLLDVAIQTFEGNGIDGSAILVNTLVEGDFLSVSNTTEDCIAECTRPLAQSLVIQKTQPPSSSVTVQPDPTDLSADESSASGS